MATLVKTESQISITKLHPEIGAEVSGVDLSQALDAATIESIRQAWYENTVLVFLKGLSRMTVSRSILDSRPRRL